MADTDKIGQINFPIKASVIAGVAVIALTAAYWYATNSFERTVLFFAGATAAAGAILGAFYSARTLAINATFLEKEQSRHSRDIALERAARWNDPSLYHVRETVRALFDTSHTSPQFAANIAAQKTNVIHFLNFLEEIAIVIEHGDADEAILKDAFLGVVVTAWSKLEAWIEAYRIARGRPNLWIKLEKLAEKWQ